VAETSTAAGHPEPARDQWPAELKPAAAPAIDQRRMRAAFARAATSFDAGDFLQRVVRERLLERPELLDLEPGRVLDLGSGTGGALPALARRFPNTDLLAMDLVPEMLATCARRRGDSRGAICASAERLPLLDGSLDLVFSNLVIHWCLSYAQVFREVRRVLRHPGCFTFTTLGPGSFIELREAWAAVDDAAHVIPFPEMHALGDALVQAGMTEAVIDTERLTISYADLGQLTSDLKATGTTNSASRRSRGLTGRRAWERFAQAYDAQRDAEGRLPVTLELVYGQAWLPGSSPTVATVPPAGDEVAFPVGRLRRWHGAR